MSSLGIFDKETKTYKKVAGTAEAAAVDDAISDTSTNPVQNKVIKAYVDKKASENVDFSTSTSKLLNDTVEAPLVLSNSTNSLDKYQVLAQMSKYHLLPLRNLLFEKPQNRNCMASTIWLMDSHS